MLDLAYIEGLIMRPPSSAIDKELMLSLVAECRELRARVAALEAVPVVAIPLPPPAPPLVESPPFGRGPPESMPTPPQAPKAKGRK